MCDLLNRIWARPRGEWTRVLRKELPTIADRMVDVLQQNIPGISALLEEMEREDLQWAVEQALLTALGYQRKRTGTAEEPVRTQPQAVRRVAAAVPIDRARRHLFAVLTGAAEASEVPLPELARSARWPLPDTVRAVALGSPCEAPQLAAALGNVLASPVEGELCLLLPDPATDEHAGAALETALRGRTAAVGHVVPLSDAASSVRWARRLLQLGPPRGAEHEVAFVSDHLSMLLLLQDESLARALSSRWLAPLADLTPRQSERLEVTLLAWLEGGGAPEAAKTLRVHPQTVRYRLRQIEKLFGAALRDPYTRFELEMTLRGRRLMAEMRCRPARAARRARAVTAGIRSLGVAREARVNGL
ncbi:PucR family transcriptional regulator [Streptomyces armeniacus]|uniref:PucR family transcriptional regulator n=1 Tax=Streptomyces armeniacus TaxID=83291 RepID=A0A345XNY2_9ACTN|nr:helix-turn-helix domain-containing protein [Streptomyces armeniacus]AXK33348.1 PucR family transcriptional regulator [Streptomyces armeniacus]